MERHPSVASLGSHSGPTSRLITKMLSETCSPSEVVGVLHYTLLHLLVLIGLSLELEEATLDELLDGGGVGVGRLAIGHVLLRTVVAKLIEPSEHVGKLVGALKEAGVHVARDLNKLVLNAGSLCEALDQLGGLAVKACGTHMLLVVLLRVLEDGAHGGTSVAHVKRCDFVGLGEGEDPLAILKLGREEILEILEVEGCVVVSDILEGGLGTGLEGIDVFLQ